ncbi:hypothetical protein GUA87_13485 [Sneathiella sp. P13V-1]|uniref:invasion associated locus B family protein n=1 Tax=Sneathiella sp. P13V-1 TaxID=2697366 RepID=UPI00187B9262|nr:invasion associated locus B family protein [Sneathiella sp. P13V-1]MBE7637863.1 hypothetical protein [Sneathiella sp. P13V-1]
MRYLPSLMLAAFAFMFLAGTPAAQETPKWNVICQDDSNPQSCRMTQNHYVQQKTKDGKTVTGKILSATIIYLADKKTGERHPHLSLQLPLGVDLRPGLIYRIDDGEQQKRSFLRCTKSGCDAAFQVDDQLLEAMLGGNEMLVGFRGWGAQQVTVVKLTLIGFTKAFSALG